MNVIEIQNLTKMYGKSRGIEDISFHVEEGEIFGFIGPNGAGKSTTIRTMLSLIYPTSGSAKIFGKDTVQFSSEVKKEIGYLPSEVFYYDNMKVKDLLKYSASFYKKDCSKRIKELAEMMELDLNRKIDDLSLGNKKKVGIVQGLLHEPKLCDRVAIIKEGKIVTVEKISTLKDNNFKRFEVESLAPIEKNYFSIPGVNDLEVTDKKISFLFKGNINTVMEKIAGIEITNLSVTEPDLEEIFMHYYEKEA